MDVLDKINEIKIVELNYIEYEEININELIDEMHPTFSGLLRKYYGINDFEHTYEQLSEIYNEPINKIKNLLYYAKNKLRCIILN